MFSFPVSAGGSHTYIHSGSQGTVVLTGGTGEVYLYIGIGIWHNVMGSGCTGFRLNHLHCATVLDGNAQFFIIWLEALILGKREVAVQIGRAHV